MNKSDQNVKNGKFVEDKCNVTAQLIQDIIRRKLTIHRKKESKV